MVNSLLGKKLGMTQIFTSDGTVIPVTVLEIGPCFVLQIKTEETDGYSSVQLGFADKKIKRATSAEIGHSKKAQLVPKRFIREVKIENGKELKLGQELNVDIFNDVSIVDVIGTSKGKGFAGVMKRWGFSGGPATHGSKSHRRPGSIGANTTPGHVVKGRKMAGRMGTNRKSIKNLSVMKVDKDKNIMIVKGAVPGANGEYIIVRKCKQANV